MVKMPTAIVQFGEDEAFGTVARRNAFGGEFSFIAPAFPPQCVCCNGETHGRMQDYNASTDQISARSFPVPVCSGCATHALQSNFAGIIVGSLLVVGIAVAALGFMYRAERPRDGFLLGMIVVGFVLTTIAILWLVVAHRRDKREATAGHHPRMSFSLDHGKTLLFTKNLQLADELVALNSSARIRRIKK